MQKSRKLPIIALVAFTAAWLLASCSDMSMFTPSMRESVGVKVLSLSQGDFLEKGDAIDFIIETEDQSDEPQLLEIVLLAQSGQTVWSTSISSPLTDEQLELMLPDLETGQYTILFTVHGEETIVEQQEFTLFYIAGSYQIRGVTSYPPTLMAGHETVLEADLLYPEGADPYIRWSRDDVILAKGAVSAGLKSITWMAPEKEGVYSILVEMFPVPPPVGSDYEFSSSVALTAQLYVSTANLLTEDELIPEDSYYSLFHLNGSLQNNGFLGKEASKEEILPFGQVKFGSIEGIMGYTVGSGAGLLYPFNILPTVGGALNPCTITARLRSDEDNKERELISINDRSGNVSFRIFFDADQQIVATLAAADTLLYLPSNIYGLEPKQHHRLDLSLVPTEQGELQALWFLNGRQSASVTDGPLPEGLPVEAETVISGANGFQGFISEIGVFFRDTLNRPAVDPAIFRSTMQQQHGRRLVLAEGFEGLYLPDPNSWQLRPGEGARLSGGRLILPAASRLTLPYFELTGEDTAFLVEFFGWIPQGSSVAFRWEGSEDAFLVIDPSGEIRSVQTNDQAQSFSPPGRKLRVTVSRQELILSTADQQLRISFDTPADENNWLSVTLQSPDREQTLEIDTILIVRQQNL